MDKELYLKIGRPHNTCTLCGTPIAVAGKHASVLLVAGEDTHAGGGAGAAAPASAAATTDADQDAGPLRQDYCPGCWEKVRQKNYYSFWIARREAPKPKKIRNRKERNTALLAYFDVLYQKKDPAYGPHLYFLAHLLMKFSVLKWMRTDPPAEAGAGERLIFRNTATDDLVTVETVPLEDETVARIKREIDDFICKNVDAEG